MMSLYRNKGSHLHLGPLAFAYTSGYSCDTLQVPFLSLPLSLAFHLSLSLYPQTKVPETL